MKHVHHEELFSKTIFNRLFYYFIKTCKVPLYSSISSLDLFFLLLPVLTAARCDLYSWVGEHRAELCRLVLKRVGGCLGLVVHFAEPNPLI